MVCFQCIEGGVQIDRSRGDFGVLLGAEVVDVLINGVAGVDLVFDSIDGSHRHGRERQVRIATAVRAAELQTLGPWIFAVSRYAYCGGAVPAGIDHVHRRFVSRNESLVTVGRRVGKGQQRRGVFEDAADGVHSHL